MFTGFVNDESLLENLTMIFNGIFSPNHIFLIYKIQIKYSLIWETVPYNYFHHICQVQT